MRSHIKGAIGSAAYINNKLSFLLFLSVIPSLKYHNYYKDLMK